MPIELHNGEHPPLSRLFDVHLVMFGLCLCSSVFGLSGVIAPRIECVTEFSCTDSDVMLYHVGQ